MIYILYSGDYEVFMGGNYRPESEVMIEPTDRVLETFDQIDAPVTLFADLLCLWRYRELGFDEFPNQVDEQIRAVVRRGHDVQMHIHPHWPRARIERHEDGSTRYTVESKWMYPGPHFGDFYEFLLQNLRHGREYLSQLLRDIDPEYRCIAYRAGGLGIMPCTRETLVALEDAGYLIDSTVTPGYPGLITPNGPVDFRNVPRQGNYRLSREGGLDKAAGEGIFEIPIAAVVARDIRTLLRLKGKAVLRRLHRRPNPHAHLGFTAAEGYRRAGQEAAPSIFRRAGRAIMRAPSLRHWGMLELVEDAKTMFAVTRSYLKEYGEQKPDLFFSLLFHPKDFVPERQAALKEYHSMLRRHYGDSIRAITFQQAADLIGPRSSGRPT